jgi:hypothetical protein
MKLMEAIAQFLHDDEARLQKRGLRRMASQDSHASY